MKNTEKAVYLHIRIAEEAKAQAESRAAKLAMTLSEYVRFLIFEDVRKSGKANQ
jgi:antitoxin component of RelBE/YafQ-DinJ toxin-antitoxin module